MSTDSLLTASEEQQLIHLLGKVGPLMSMEVYNAIAAKFVLTAIETVVIRSVGGHIEVLLLRRSPEDVHYRNMWHSPGTMLRDADAPRECDVPGTLAEAFNRVQNNEIGCQFQEPPIFVNYVFQRTPRGSENGLVFLCKLAGDPKEGQFFRIDKLPENLMQHHRWIIELAAQYYRERVG